MRKQTRKLHDDENEKRLLLKECFGIEYNGEYICSCCSKKFNKQCRAFEHCFKLFVECLKKNELLKKEISSTVKEILTERNLNNSNQIVTEKNSTDNNQENDNQQIDVENNSETIEQENRRFSEIKPRKRESEIPNKEFIIENYVDSMSSLDSRFHFLKSLNDSIKEKLFNQENIDLQNVSFECKYYEKCLFILQENYDDFVLKHRKELCNELDNYIVNFKSSFGSNANGIVFQTTEDIIEEIQIIKRMDKNISQSLIHIISKLFYLIYFIMNPSMKFIKIKKLQNEYLPMVVNLENKNNNEMVWYYEFYITMLIILNNLSLTSFYLLSQFLSSILIQFQIKLERDLPSSYQTISRRIKEISFHFRYQIIQEIENCLFFSLSYDCVRDSTSDKNFIGVTILLVDKWNRRKHFLLDFLPFSGNAITINNVIFSIFNSMELSAIDLFTKKCISLSTDNGGDCRKSRRTICEKFKCISLQCLCHQLSLIYNSGFKTVSIFENVLKITKLIRSEKFKLKFKLFINGKKSIKRFINVRWCSMTDVFLSVYNLYDDIVLFIKNQINEFTSISPKTDENQKHLNDLIEVFKIINDNFFYPTLVVILDILIYEKEIMTSFQGNNDNNNIINYFSKYDEFISFLNKNKNYLNIHQYRNVFKLTFKLKQLSSPGFFYSLIQGSKYIEMMFDNYQTGHLGKSRRFQDLENLRNLYEICKCPLKCNIDYYKIFEKLEPRVVEIMETIQDDLLIKFDSIDIFTLSNLIYNPTIQLISSYVSCIKFTSYDVETLFSSMKKCKTFERSSLNDETLKDILFIKMNSKYLKIDLKIVHSEYNEFNTIYKDTIATYWEGNSKNQKDLLLDPLNEHSIVYEDDCEDEIYAFDEYNEWILC